MIKKPAVRWLMTIILLGILGFQLWSRSNHFANLSLISFQKSLWWFMLVVVLMPANWILETIKWRTLLTIHVRVPFIYTLKTVAGGVALSIFTPNRIGEYGGRILYMPANARWPVAISTLTGSFAQNLIAFSVGVFSSVFLFKGILILKICGLILAAVGFFCFFNIRRVISRISTLKIHSIFRKLGSNLRFVDEYSSGVLLKVLGFAFLRYMVYTTQYVLILHAFEPEIQIRILFLGVSVVYLFQTVVPLPPLADVMARANIGLVLWAGTGMGELSITLSSLMIWLINLLIPALIGSFIIGTTAPLISLDTNESNIPSAYMPLASKPTGKT
ncbi:MAG: lysylphosphatidylglycerol synthase domain-containing protein [Saprospiraceae bacterium]